MKKAIFNTRSLGQCTMVFADEAKIETAELADFLFLFRGVYAAGIQVVDSLPKAEIEPVELVRLIRAHLRRLNVSQINDLFRQDLGTNRLFTERISRDSPTELVIDGVILITLAAVILSGGEFELGPLKVRLRPVGEGVRSLREALTSGTRTHVGYGIKSRVVSLSKEELALLMLQDPTKEHSGGFQAFLVGLQKRVKQRTGQLELSEKDMDRILRAMRNRSKGGFQDRIHKIFSRHFGVSERY